MKTWGHLHFTFLICLVMPTGGSALEMRNGKPPSASISTHMEKIADKMEDSEIRVSRNGKMRAWISFPTERYDHAVLGDGIEGGGVTVEFENGTRLTFKLPKNSVFEDRYPRWADLDGDGAEEIFLVRSYIDRGAALVVLEIDQKGIRIGAETPPIGLSHRWLNPIGAGDLDGDGFLEIAYVETPHIGGKLRVFRYKDATLTQIASLSGFSNHAMGTRQLQLAMMLDMNGDGKNEIFVPGADRRVLRVVSLQEGSLKVDDQFIHPAPISTNFISSDLDDDGDLDLKYGLSNGQWVEWLLP